MHRNGRHGSVVRWRSNCSGPRTTLIAYLLCEDGEPTTTIGCPGGDDQAQADLQIILNLLVFGMSPQRAIEAPRFATQSFPDSFKFEEKHIYKQVGITNPREQIDCAEQTFTWAGRLAVRSREPAT